MNKIYGDELVASERLLFAIKVDPLFIGLVVVGNDRAKSISVM